MNFLPAQTARAPTMLSFCGTPHVECEARARLSSTGKPSGCALWFPNATLVPQGGGGGAGRTHNIFGWGCAVRYWKPLPYFRPKYTIFHTLFQTWLSKCMPYFRPCDVWQFPKLAIDLRRTGLPDAPRNDVRVFFLRDQCPRQHTLL